MIPDTWAALLALLGLVAPGLVFQLRRERRRPAFSETTFREISRVALSSLVLTTASLVLLLLLAQVWPTLLPDGARWTSDSAYVREDYLRVGLFLGLEVLVACALALVVEAMTAGELDSRMASGSVLFRVLDRDKPTQASRGWLWVTLQDGSQYKGALRGTSLRAAPPVGPSGRRRLLGGTVRRRPSR